jgi:hypothetical protein
MGSIILSMYLCVTLSIFWKQVSDFHKTSCELRTIRVYPSDVVFNTFLESVKQEVPN